MANAQEELTGTNAFLHKIIFQSNEEPSPQQFMASWFWNRYERSFSKEEIALYYLHRLGVLPPCPEGMDLLIMNARTLIYDFKDSRFMDAMATLCGDVPLNHRAQGQVAKVVTLHTDMLDLDEEIKGRPGNFTEEEVKSLINATTETKRALLHLAGMPYNKDGADHAELLCPKVGDSHGSSVLLMRTRLQHELFYRDHGLLSYLFKSISGWAITYAPGEVIPNDEAVSREIRAQIMERHGEEAVLTLAEFASEIYEDKAQMMDFPPLLPALSWTKLLEASRLYREYNLEWALAAVDWHSPETTSTSMI